MSTWVVILGYALTHIPSRLMTAISHELHLEGKLDKCKALLVAFSPNGQFLAVGSTYSWYDDPLSTCIIRLVDSVTLEEIRRIGKRVQNGNDICFSPDGRLIAVAYTDDGVTLCDVETGECVRTLVDPACTVMFSPDGQTLVTGSLDRSVRAWRVETGEKLMELKGHTGWIRSVGVSPDGFTFASGSLDTTAVLWEAKTGNPRAPLQGHEKSIMSIAFSPNGETLATGSSDRTVILWDTQTGARRFTLNGFRGCVMDIVFSPDGRTLACSTDNGARDDYRSLADGDLMLWDTGRWELKTQVVGVGTWQRGRSLSFSPDSKRLAVASVGSGCVRVYTV